MGLGVSCCRDVKCHCTIYVLGSREKKGSVGCALAVELHTEIFPLRFSWEAGILRLVLYQSTESCSVRPRPPRNQRLISEDRIALGRTASLQAGVCNRRGFGGLWHIQLSGRELQIVFLAPAVL